MQLWLPKHDFICNLGDSEAVTCQKKRQAEMCLKILKDDSLLLFF